MLILGDQLEKGAPKKVLKCMPPLVIVRIYEAVDGEQGDISINCKRSVLF